MTQGRQISRTEYVTPKTVPEMSLPTKTLGRLQKIKEGLRQGLNRDEIALSCRVDEKTIDRDIKTWTETGFFEQWLKEEFLRLHAVVEGDDPVEAYRQIGNLVKANMTRKVEQKNEQIGQIVVKLVDPDSPNQVQTP